MDGKEEFLSHYYENVDRTKVKIELPGGMTDISEILAAGAAIDYGEYRGGILKYKLCNINPKCFTELLKLHTAGRISLCVYFQPLQNSLVAFNLDQMKNDTNDCKAATLILAAKLSNMSLNPLVLKSGRGYHIWCRLEVPRKNTELVDFTRKLKFAVQTELDAHGGNHENVALTVYPRTIPDDVSIRIFGGRHSRTCEFSRVVTAINLDDTLLTEEESWQAFAWYDANGAAAPEAVANALREVAG